VGNSSQYLLSYKSVVGEKFSPTPFFGVFTQAVPIGDPDKPG
jgi:hypothetical protein